MASIMPCLTASATCQRVDQCAARRRLVRGPVLAAVVAVVDLAAVGGTGHQCRAAFVDRQSEECVWRADTLRARPGIAAVAAVQQHALVALKIRSGADEDLAGIAGNFLDFAAIDLALG